MRIITSGSLKDFYDRYSNPTDRDLTWVRTLKPVYANEKEVQGIQHYAGGFNYGFKPYLEEKFLGNGDVYRENHKSMPMDYDPLIAMNLREEFWNRRHNFRYNGEKIAGRYYKTVVIFCGVVYRGIIYGEPNMSEGYAGTVHEIGCRYRTYWTVESFAEAHCVQVKDIEKMSEVQQFEETCDRMRGWFEPKQDHVKDVCVELNTPVLVHCYQDNKEVWMTNGLVKDLQFIKVMDPQTAFQELEMYVGGVMVKKETIAPVPDKLKVQSHGMDERSFRKDPTKVHR